MYINYMECHGDLNRRFIRNCSSNFVPTSYQLRTKLVRSLTFHVNKRIPNYPKHPLEAAKRPPRGILLSLDSFGLQISRFLPKSTRIARATSAINFYVHMLLRTGLRFSYQSWGEVYTGEWRGAKAAGYGRIVRPDGSTYEGQWTSDAAHGEGTETYPDGSWYRGGYL